MATLRQMFYKKQQKSKVLYITTILSRYVHPLEDCLELHRSGNRSFNTHREHIYCLLSFNSNMFTADFYKRKGDRVVRAVSWTCNTSLLPLATFANSQMV